MLIDESSDLRLDKLVPHGFFLATGGSPANRIAIPKVDLCTFVVVKTPLSTAFCFW
jgi:hypothetical protein